MFNDQPKYEACIARLEVNLELGAIWLDMIEDSNWIVSQANGDRKESHISESERRRIIVEGKSGFYPQS
ncbi:hypothetical protein ACSBR2_026595 [Camellia fascicularis]